MIMPWRFQSTHSMRSATHAYAELYRYMDISIHALHAECDGYRFPKPNVAEISIHALHAECDDDRLMSKKCDRHFNPRTPCGVRPVLPFLLTWDMLKFQSTHSMRSATVHSHKKGNRVNISIHALHAECDFVNGSPLSMLLLFQSTHSMRSATLSLRYAVNLSTFQSTHSMRSATYLFKYVTLIYVFQSTHSMRSATCSLCYFSSFARFQSTHSMRSATRVFCKLFC